MKIRSIVALAIALTIAGVHSARAQGVKCADGTVAKDKAGCTAHGGVAKVVKAETKAAEKAARTEAKTAEKVQKTEKKAEEKAEKAEARTGEKVQKSEKKAVEKTEKAEAKTEKAEEKAEKAEAKGEKEPPKLVEWKCKDGTIWRGRFKKTACPGRHGGVKE